MLRLIRCPYCKEENIYSKHKCSSCSKGLLCSGFSFGYFLFIFIVSMLISLYVGVETCLLSVFINFPAILLIGYSLGILFFPDNF